MREEEERSLAQTGETKDVFLGGGGREEGGMSSALKTE